MLAQIRKSILLKYGTPALLLCATVCFVSCATKPPPPLIPDPTTAGETALPWNEQQKWEREGEAAALNQERR
jgi:hypothetical protein